MKQTALSCANKLKTLSDKTRLSVIRQLLNGPKHVWEINKQLKIDKTLLSHHLKILKEADLITAQRKGKSILYSLNSIISDSGKAINLKCCTLNFK